MSSLTFNSSGPLGGTAPSCLPTPPWWPQLQFSPALGSTASSSLPLLWVAAVTSQARLSALGFPYPLHSLPRGCCDFPKQTSNLITSIHCLKIKCTFLNLARKTLSRLFHPYLSNLIFCIGEGGGPEVVSSSVVLTLVYHLDGTIVSSYFYISLFMVPPFLSLHLSPLPSLCSDTHLKSQFRNTM